MSVSVVLAVRVVMAVGSTVFQFRTVAMVPVAMGMVQSTVKEGMAVFMAYK